MARSASSKNNNPTLYKARGPGIPEYAGQATTTYDGNVIIRTYNLCVELLAQ